MKQYTRRFVIASTAVIVAAFVSVPTEQIETAPEDSIMPSSTAGKASQTGKASKTGKAWKPTVTVPPGQTGQLTWTSLGVPEFTRTFESIGIRIPFTGGYYPEAELLPNGVGSGVGWSVVGAATMPEAIDESDINLPDDADYILSPDRVTSSVFFTLQDTPATFDPDGLTQASVVVRGRKQTTGAAGTSDQWTIGAQLYDVTETIPYSDEKITDPFSGTPTTSQLTVTLTAAGIAATKSDWDGARLRLRAIYKIQEAQDAGSQARITQSKVTLSGPKVTLQNQVYFKRTSEPDRTPWGYNGGVNPGGWRLAYNTDGNDALWRSEAGVDRQLAGSILMLTHNTSYDVKIIITENRAGGGTITYNASGSASSNFGTLTHPSQAGLTTRNDGSTQPHNTESFAFTRYVSPAGNNAWDGTTPAFVSGTTGPWRSIQQAWTEPGSGGAPSGAVVRVAPGWYKWPTNIRTSPIVLRAQYPSIAKDASRTIIDSAAAATQSTVDHSVIYGRLLAPTKNSAGTLINVSDVDAENYNPSPAAPAATWTQVGFTGPNYGGSYTLWKYTNGAPLNVDNAVKLFVNNVSVALRKDATKYMRVAFWHREDQTQMVFSGKDGKKWVMQEATATQLTNAGLSAGDDQLSRFVELFFTNVGYRYGSFTWGTDVYIRMPRLATEAEAGIASNISEDSDPNKYWMLLHEGGSANQSTGRQMILDAPDSRVSGFNLAGGPQLWFNAHAQRSTFDRLLIQQGQFRCNGAGYGLTAVFGVDNVIQYCRQYTTGGYDTTTWLRDANGLIGGGVQPWGMVKRTVRVKDNASTDLTETPGYTSNGSWKRALETTETGFIQGKGQRQLVLRFNSLYGTFNGFSSTPTEYGNISQERDWDVHDWYVTGLADNIVEPSPDTCLNVRCWNLKGATIFNFVETGPISYGPLYLFNNDMHDISGRGIAPFLNGFYDGAGNGGLGVKYSGMSIPCARVIFAHNVMWSDEANGTNGANCAATNNKDNPELYELYNNIIRMTQRAWKAWRLFQLAYPDIRVWREDYNFFATTDEAFAMTVPDGTVYGSSALIGALSIAAYRTATDQGAHTNKIAGQDYTFTDTGSFPGVAFIDAALNNPAAGDVTLKAGSPFINAGRVIDNIRDIAYPGVGYGPREPWMYNGSAPDLGCYEHS